MKKYLILGAMLGTVSLLHSVSYDLGYEKMYIENKTDRDVVVRFFNEYYQQQVYPMRAYEHRYVKVNEGVMKNLYSIRVTMEEPKTGKTITRDIDYEPDQGINGLKIKMKPELELSWRYEDEEGN